MQVVLLTLSVHAEMIESIIDDLYPRLLILRVEFWNSYSHY